MNQPPFLIIDGYNLFHAAGLARSQYATGELHRQRERLLKLVGAGLSTLERQQTTIVFDAPVSQSGFERAVEFEGIAVLFSQPGFEADDVIESLIDRHPAVRRLVVVSNDRRLQMSARSRRASCLDCEAFLKRLTRQSQPDSAAIKNEVSDELVERLQPGSSSEEVSFWLREFGTIDVNAIQAEALNHDQNERQDEFHRDALELQRILDDDRALDEWLNQSP